MLIDLNAERVARAARREGASTHIDLELGPEKFQLPAELPMTAIYRLIDPDVEIAQMLITVVKAFAKSKDEDFGDVIIANLADNPHLPAGFVRAALAVLEQLFGAEQWARYMALDPSFQDNWALIVGLYRAYGVSLGEALRSPDSPETDGATSKATSAPTAVASMPAAFGPPPVPQLSSAFGG